VKKTKKNKKLPVKKEKNHYSFQGCDSIKGGIEMPELFRLIYQREGNESEVQVLRNRLNAKRSNPGLDIVGQFVERLPHLQNMTLAEFFKIKVEK